VSGHPKVLDAQAGVFPSEIAEVMLLRASRYRDLAREARLAATQINENVRDPFIRVATQWERLAREVESGREASV
jgi:hypothetical protein